MILDLQKHYEAQQKRYNRYEKFELLKQPVYSKAKSKARYNFPHQNLKKSVKSLYTPQQSPKNSKKRLTLPKPLLPNQLKEQNLLKKRSTESLKMKEYRTIAIEYDNNKTGNFSEKSNNRTNNGFMNSQFFGKNSLRKTNFEKKDVKQTKIKDRSDQINKNFFQGTDAQRLLRKNSLFLLTFIKTREKQKKRSSCIGDMPALTQLLRLKDFDIQAYQIRQMKKQYSYENDKNKKQRINQLKYKRFQPDQKPIVPQPW